MTKLAPPTTALLLALAACSSTPTTDRPAVERPESQRPEGVEPEGLRDVRGAIAEQRAEARQRENALSMKPSTLTPASTEPWYETVFGPIADLLQFLRNL